MTIIANAPNGGNNIQTIDFNGQQLLTIEKNGVQYAAVKPIAENIGLNWDSQRKRITRDDVLNSVAVMMTATGTDNKQYDMMCLPIEFLNGWLFGVDAKRVKPEVKAPLIQYKMQCYKVLHDYWHTGAAIHPTVNEELPSSVKDRNGLIKTVHMAMKRLDLGFSEAFNLVLHRFNVAHVGDLTQSQVGDAVEYLHRLMFTGSTVSAPTEQTEQTPHFYYYRNNDRLVSQVDLQGRLWTRPLADHEFLISITELPKFINDCDDLDLQELTALSYAVSKKMVEAQTWSNVVMVGNDGERS
ncbi:MAG: phage antirepressor N-terminal domain-containing protein [Psychrobacter sp.]